MMADFTIKMPDVGEGVTEAEIVAWHVSVGDLVEEDQDLCDVMTDKATVEIPSPVSGRVLEVVGAAGEMVPVGSMIIRIDTGAADVAGAHSTDAGRAETPVSTDNVEVQSASSQAVQPDRSSKPATAIAPAAVSNANSKPLASPAVRQRALELDINLTHVTGSGPAGRVLAQDLEDFVAAGGRAIAKAGVPSGNQPQTGTTTTKVIGLRRKIAQNMERAWTVPLITYVEEIDVTEVEALRMKLNAQKSSEQPKLTLLPFIAAALIKALRKVPNANAHYDTDAETLTVFDGVHLGVATATDKGLIVPVVRHAEALDLWQTANEIARLSVAAREGTAKREELSGSTVTITSLGALGGIVTTPILNPPETAIIGVNKMVERPVFDGSGNVVPRKFMNLSSSFDHRIVDGYDAAILIQAVRNYLETPATLFIPGI